MPSAVISNLFSRTFLTPLTGHFLRRSYPSRLSGMAYRRVSGCDSKFPSTVRLRTLIYRFTALVKP